MDARTPFEIDLTSPKATILVGGEDIADKVQGLQLTADAKGAVLTLYGAAMGTITAEGVVQVAVDSDPAEAIATFLKSIDPAALESTALRRMTPGDNLTRVMLDQLTDWASGG